MTRCATWSGAVRGRTVRGGAVAAVAAASVALLGACGSAGSSAAPAPTTTTLVTTTPVAPTATVTDTPPARTVTATPSTRTVTATPTSVPTATAPGPSTPTTAAPTSAPAGPSATGSGGSGSPAPCRTSDLAVGMGGGSGGAAGSVYTGITFRNTGSSACSLDGHPGVSYVAGSDGHQVGAAAGRTGTPSRVVLAPGALASASLQIVQYAAYPRTRCKPVAVRGFRVYPPDQTAAAFVPSSGTACSATSTPLLTVAPVQAGPATR